MTDQTNDRSVRLEPAVSEEWVREVVKRDVSPNEFAEWLLANVDLHMWLQKYRGNEARSEQKQDERATQVEKAEPESVANPGRSSRSDEDEGWTKELFFDFLEVVSSIPDLEWSLALLNAYYQLGPMPSSKQLKELCGFVEDHAWQQELRIAKQRLTLQARKMDAPPLFPRARSSEGKRLHPLEPQLFPWLKDWIEGREEGSAAVEGGGLPAPEHWGESIRESEKYIEKEKSA